MYLRTALFTGMFLFGCFVHSDDSFRQSLIFYENCDSLKSNNAGVRIPGSIRLEDGKYGKAFRIERRTFNLAVNGDFQKKEPGDWIYDGNLEWQPKNGINDSSCLLLKDGASASFSLMKLIPDSPYAVSFYARGDGKISLISDCGGKQTVLINEQGLSEKFERCKTVMYPRDSVGILKFISKGNIYIDNVMIDQGVAFFNSFSEPLKRRPVDIIEIPADKGYIDPASGSISCWINTPWFDPEVHSKDGSALISVLNADRQIKRRADNEILAVTVWDSVFLCMFDNENRSCTAGFRIVEMKDTKEKWHHVVLTWKLENGNMNTEIYVDGGNIHITESKPFGPVKKTSRIYLGYSGGGYLNGLLDEFAIFKRPLKESEIKAIYTSGQALSEIMKQ